LVSPPGWGERARERGAFYGESRKMPFFVIPKLDRGIGTKDIISSWQIKEISIQVFDHHDHPARNMKPWEMMDRCIRRTSEITPSKIQRKMAEDGYVLDILTFSAGWNIERACQGNHE
jgi:hypothetical protein